MILLKYIFIFHNNIFNIIEGNHLKKIIISIKGNNNE